MKLTNKRLAYVSLSILTALLMVLDFCSDLFIRSRGLDGKHGVNASAMDATSTIMITAWVYATVRLWFDKGE